VLAVLLIAAPGFTSVSAASGKAPNLSGKWLFTAPGAGFEIRSGRSTRIGGSLLAEGAPFGSLDGSISDGTGVLYSGFNGTITETFVITGVSGNVMTGFIADDVNSEAPPAPPATIGECDADKQASTDASVAWACTAFTATRGGSSCRVASAMMPSPIARIASVSYYLGSANGQTFTGSWDCNNREIRVRWTAAIPCKQKSAPKLAPIIEKVHFDFRGKTQRDGTLKGRLETQKLETGKVYGAFLDNVRVTPAALALDYGVDLVQHPGVVEVYDCHIAGTATAPIQS
jgi:hypothetical protein